jgi:endoribonuclease Dicer
MVQPSLSPDSASLSDLETHDYDSDSGQTDASADHELLQDSETSSEDPSPEDEAARLDAFQDAIVRQAEVEQRNKAADPSEGLLVRSRHAMETAREYQQELFERAKDENIIAVLDTGMGKTLIAAMLIRHVLDQSILSDQRKCIFFLANNVPLVHQQARYLTNNLPVLVQPLTGSDGVDKWNGDTWRNILNDVNVFVCTAAVLEQALFHNFVRMGTISLIVFDEAHHCKKSHPYSRIVKDYYLKTATVEERPRLFSMTASPIDSKKNVADTLANLQELLHSKIVTVPDASLVDWAYKPKDIMWEYDYPGPEVRTPLSESLNQLAVLLPSVQADLRNALKISSHLGTWFSDRMLRHNFGTDELVRTLYGKFERGTHYAQMSEAAREDFRERLFAAPAEVRQQCTLALQPQLPYMSPKVQLLYEKLNDLFTKNADARAMVFVTEKWTSVVLCEAFQALNIPHLNPGYLTGSGSISIRQQEETMQQFKIGAINVLFTTSVGEEGIDIPQCNIVVRFDLSNTTIQYIQGRGRARMKDSIYAHMIERHNPLHRDNVEFCIADAKYIKDYCQQLPADRMLGKGTKLAQMLARESSYRSFTTSAGVCCNFSNCLVILSRYASSLYHIGATTSETYEEVLQEDSDDPTFQYVVRLEVVGESIVKGAKGEPRPNKILAKRSAAFECVVKLRAAGLLDDNLDSKFKRTRRVERRMAVNERKHPYDMISKPRLWTESLGVAPDTLYATTIDFEPASPLASPLAPMVMLTRVPLPTFPNFPIFLEDDIQTDVVTRSVGSFAIQPSELEALTCYTLNAVFQDVFNKRYEHDASKMAYWLVPRNCSGGEAATLDAVVDFNQMKASAHPRGEWKDNADASKWCNAWLVDPLSGKHHYITETVVNGVSIHDPEPLEFLPKIGKKREQQSIIDFTDSHWRKDERNKFTKRRDGTQPVLKAEEQSLRRNFLDKPTEQEKQRLTRWIAPEPLLLGRLTVEAARAALAWPSIIHRIEAYLIVLEALKLLGLDGIPAELALEAFTKDNNIDDQEARTHATKCRGMGSNYERLEFIGDALLKLCSTLAVYIRTLAKEGDMHDRRKYILCNDTLCNISVQGTHMYQYIRSDGFNRLTWYPENMVLIGGRGATGEGVKHEQQSHDLGNKTIADVSEATIGAAVMTCAHLPVETRFDLGIRAISKLTGSEDHQFSSWADFAAQHNFQDWQTRQDDPLANQLAATLERLTGYKFNFPRLARSAFTHPSEMNSPVSDYQRLEFLGDAVFDWVAIWLLFITNPSRNPEWLTEHKMAMVSNQFLAALAVLLEFDKLLFITNVKMKAAISEYASECRARRAEEGPDHPDFWRRIKSPPPKALADLVEATLGAMLVDSNFSYAPIEAFFTTHVQPFFENIELYDGYANKHPTSLIHKVINGEYGCRQFRIEVRNMKGEKVDAEAYGAETAYDEFTNVEEGEEIMATVFIHSTALDFSHGTSARYAKVRACSKALRVLDGLSRVGFRERFGCYCGEAGVEVYIVGSKLPSTTW